MNVLDWVKGNILIVVFVVLMVAAPIGMFFVASGMNESVRADVKKRADSLPQIKKIKDNTIEVLGLEPKKGVINEKFISDYERVAGVMSKDADTVRQGAIDHNRKGRDVLMRDVLPSMPATQVEVLPKRFHDALIAAYESLLRDIHAGSPPDSDSLVADLERGRSEFITRQLQMDPGEKLSDEQAQQLAKELSNRRLNRYSEAADGIRLYVTADALGIPQWQQSMLPTPAQILAWQWAYWIQSDVLRALAQANEADQKVARAPVKRVHSVTVLNLPFEGASNSSGGRTAGGMGSGSRTVGGGASADELSGEEEGAPPLPAAGASADPKAAVPFDYSASISGRKTNPLYDVVLVDIRMDVETARLPEVINALSRYNFFTVLSLQVIPADSFEAAKMGFIYGSSSVSEVAMVLETVWLRDWTTQFMPDEAKKALNIPVAQPPPEVIPPESAEG